jgi:lipid II:glycine glycyltransferase (peptidoglycan interpeptide bridge formation enzyme)
MVHSDGVRAYYTIAGCSPEGFQCNAPGYLIWKMMLALKNDGVLSLNLGGVKEEASSDGNIAHGLYSFKKSFGSEEVSCIDWHCDDLGVRSKLAKIIKVAL